MKLWYAFSEKNTDGDRTLRNTLGGKGANLAEICKLGVPVPPGFTLPTELCLRYYDDDSKLSDDVGTLMGMVHVWKARARLACRFAIELVGRHETHRKVGDSPESTSWANDVPGTDFANRDSLVARDREQQAIGIEKWAEEMKRWYMEPSGYWEEADADTGLAASVNTIREHAAKVRRGDA